MERFKRVFVVVMDSLGVGAMPDSADFGDIGVNTLGHISESVDTFKIPNLQKLGMANIIPLKQVPANEHPIGYYGNPSSPHRWSAPSHGQSSWIYKLP